MEHYYEGIEGWFDYQDLYSLIVRKHLLPPNPTIVEVGCYLGKATAHLSTELINTGAPFKLVCVDGWDNPDFKDIIDLPVPLQDFKDNIEPSLRNLHRNQSIEARRNLSHLEAKFFADSSIDFCFIDACHDYENVRRDIDAWLPKMKPNGIIAGHDFIPHFDGVMKAVRETWPRGVRISNTAWYVCLQNGVVKEF